MFSTFPFLCQVSEKKEKKIKVFSGANISLRSRPTKVAASIPFRQIPMH